MPSDRDAKHDKDQQAAVVDSFPASDPPSKTGEQGPRAVPAETLLGRAHPPRRDAIAIERRFPDLESAKLALEALVRDGPLDPDVAELQPDGAEVALRVMAPPGDAERLRGLLRRR